MNIRIMLRRLLEDGVVKVGREEFAYYLTFDTIEVIRGLSESSCDKLVG